MNTLMICPGMVCKLVASCVVFERRCVVQQSNVLFLCLDLNGFKEARSQQESEEENGCGLTGFGVVMFLRDGWALGSGPSLREIFFP